MQRATPRIALLVALLSLGACGEPEPRIDATTLQSTRESFEAMRQQLPPDEYTRLQEDLRLISFEAMGGERGMFEASFGGRTLNEAAMHARMGRWLHGKTALDIFREAASIRAAKKVVLPTQENEQP
jgi:hypothetical protein